jgi:hypothetical protein
MRIAPSVAQATVDELIAAGWGDYPRHLIPDAWRTRKPRKPARRPRTKRNRVRLLRVIPRAAWQAIGYLNRRRKV